jgi:hypothetical protein
MVIVLGESRELRSVQETPRQVHDVALTTDYTLQTTLCSNFFYFFNGDRDKNYAHARAFHSICLHMWFAFVIPYAYF